MKVKGIAVAALMYLSAASVVAETTALDALNSYRNTQNRTPLAYSTALEAAAQTHANDMAQKDFFDHTGSDGSDVAARVSRLGYGWCVVAENIAKGQLSLADVMQAWIASPGHRRNMLSDEVTEFALAEGYGHIWVMVLAAPGC